MGNLLTIGFWFKKYPGTLSPTTIKLFIAVILILLITALVLKVITKKSKERLYRRLYRKIISALVTNIFLISFFMFLMYEAVPYLGSRFWILLLAIVNLFWVYKIFVYYRSIDQQKEELKRIEEKEKYHP